MSYKKHELNIYINIKNIYVINLKLYNSKINAKWKNTIKYTKKNIKKYIHIHIYK